MFDGHEGRQEQNRGRATGTHGFTFQGGPFVAKKLSGLVDHGPAQNAGYSVGLRACPEVFGPMGYKATYVFSNFLLGAPSFVAKPPFGSPRSLIVPSLRK